LKPTWDLKNVNKDLIYIYFSKKSFFFHTLYLFFFLKKNVWCLILSFIPNNCVVIHYSSLQKFIIYYTHSITPINLIDYLYSTLYYYYFWTFLQCYWSYVFLLTPYKPLLHFFVSHLQVKNNFLYLLNN